MRFIRDSLIALTVIGLVSGAYYRNTTEQARRASEDAARENVQRIQRQVMLQYALSATPEEGDEDLPGWHDYPRTIKPDWFGPDVPRNPLLPLAHPWLEIAAREEHDQSHPRDLVAADRGTATFWYNPKTGIVRARVPASASDASTLQLYNYINNSSLRDLFVGEALAGQIAGANP